MENNNPLSIGWMGAVKQNGVPLINQVGYFTKGGNIQEDETNVPFGCVVSEDPANQGVFYKGIDTGRVISGVLYCEESTAQNEPAKPDYLIGGQQASVIFKQGLWLQSWSKTAVGAIDPEPGCIVIFKNTTGVIEFLQAGTAAIPSGYTQLNAVFVSYNARHGVLIFLELDVSKLANADEAKDITEYKFTAAANGGVISEDVIGVISGSNIALSVPHGTPVTGLKATFTLSSGASAKVGSTAQVSGTTANNFTSAVSYVVTATNSTTKTYTVTVTVLPA